ncbi:MAG: M28 family peptidase [Terriglobales bacterium]
MPQPVILIRVRRMITCSPRLRAAALSFFIMTAFAACNRSSTSAAASESAPQPAAASMSAAASLPHADGQRALQYTREVVAFGPRFVGSPGHAQTEAYLRQELKDDNLQEDTFTASTPAGSLRMTNFIAKFPGSKDGIIVVTGHYDTLYGRKDFVGANDGGSSTGLLLELARQLRGKKLDGYSVWLVWFDGEEAIRQWSPTDSVYGSRHLAAKWAKGGTLKKIQAFLLLDMIGDADLNIERDSNSTPWLEDVIYKAATGLGYASHFFAHATEMQDDHLPFARAGVPVADLIDYNYGPNNSYWHTPQDTLDKLSPQSLEIVGSVVLETIRLLNQS